MTPGFKKRLIQEVKHLIETLDEFEELRVHVDMIRVPDSVFPPNCAAWVGASLLGNLNNEIDRFLLTSTQYIEEERVLPDRFGDAFLNFEREGNYFNKNFEDNLRMQKVNLYSNTTPYSARSLASKRESIATMLKRNLQEKSSVFGDK